jgi:Na+-transporting NADH:ubiquinone oxidoreductase subunit NqrB
LYIPNSIGGNAANHTVIMIRFKSIPSRTCAALRVMSGGHQALTAMQAAGVDRVGDWHWILIELLGGYDPTSVWHCFWYGAAFFLPIYIVTFGVGIAWEILFAIKRGHEVNETWLTDVRVPVENLVGVENQGWT